METRYFVGLYIITIVAVLQVIAWTIGFDGAVFAFTSLCIGLITGALLEFEWGPKRKN